MLIKGTTTENIYQIRWAQPNYQGKGTYSWPNGSRYDGEFLDGKLQGHGIFFWPDGSSYKGEWHEDLPHGKGTFTWPDGRHVEIEWEHGKAKQEGVPHPAEEDLKHVVPDESRLKGGDEEEKRLIAELQDRLSNEQAKRKAEEEARRAVRAKNRFFFIVFSLVEDLVKIWLLTQFQFKANLLSIHIKSNRFNDRRPSPSIHKPSTKL